MSRVEGGGGWERGRVGRGATDGRRLFFIFSVVWGAGRESTKCVDEVLKFMFANWSLSVCGFWGRRIDACVL